MPRYFVIRQKSTGWCLPDSSTKNGHTWSEPTPPELFPPRLFLKKKAARVSLAWWLKGTTHKVTTPWASSLESLGSDDYDVCLKTIPVPGRDPDDMEVAVVRLEVLGEA